MFDFEIQHRSATKHRGPDGLSRRRQAEDDSSDSDIESEPETVLNRATGECLPLEVKWLDPIVIEEDSRESNLIFRMFEGKAVVPNRESSADKLANLKLPEDRKRRAQIANRARSFFILENMKDLQRGT